jgi:hypothetical protein
MENVLPTISSGEMENIKTCYKECIEVVEPKLVE